MANTTISGSVVKGGIDRPQDADVLIQAGHEGRTSGLTGSQSLWGKEIEWTPIVADEATRLLKKAGVTVIRECADLKKSYHVKIALFLHFDGATYDNVKDNSEISCKLGASVGYTPTDENSKKAAAEWKEFYTKRGFWPFKWMNDNYTEGLSKYYGYRIVDSDVKLVLELGEITCPKQAEWLKPRLKMLGCLIAQFVGQRISKKVTIPSLDKFSLILEPRLILRPDALRVVIPKQYILPKKSII